MVFDLSTYGHSVSFTQTRYPNVKLCHRCWKIGTDIKDMAMATESDIDYGSSLSAGRKGKSTNLKTLLAYYLQNQT